MPTEKTITLYTYDELSDKAKDRARQWWMECRGPEDFDSVVEDFKQICGIIGIEPKTHEVRLYGGGTRQDPNIWWSVGYCQSDFAAFEGRYTYEAGCVAKIKAYAPQDECLHAIVKQLADIQKAHFYQLAADVTYSDYYGVQLEVSKLKDDWAGVGTEAYQELKETFKRLNRWLYGLFREEDEYLSSDEYVTDAMEANGYTFREDGTRED